MTHTHNFTRRKANSTVETCSCGKFRHTDKNTNPIIEEIKPIERRSNMAHPLITATKDFLKAIEDAENDPCCSMNVGIHDTNILKTYKELLEQANEIPLLQTALAQVGKG